MTTASPEHARLGSIVQGWRGFRTWRRARPFWGGLLLLLAGLEIFQSTQASLGGLTFQMGPSGYLSWLIPTILAACGLLMWFTPQQRMFYAIIGAMTAVFSLIAVNLGGFFIGLLLGMVGGALGFAWTPLAPVPATEGEGRTGTGGDDSLESPVEDSAVDELMAGPLTDTLPQPRNPLREQVEPAAPGDESAEHGTAEHGGPDPARDLPETPAAPTDQSGYGSLSRRSPPAFVITLIMLSAAVIGAVTLSGQAAHADACPSPVKPTASATAPVPASSATPSPDAVQQAGSSGIPTTDPTTSAEGTPTGAPVGKPAPTSSTCSTRKPAAKADQPTGSTRRLAAAADQPAVAKRPSRLTGSKLTMTGLKLEGVVDLPTADGTLRVLKFSMRKAVTRDFKLQIPGGRGTSMVIKSSALTVDGDVAFYTTRFIGRILGVEVILTPESPVPPDGIDLTVPVIVFDDPDVQLAFVNCDTLVAPKLNERFA